MIKCLAVSRTSLRTEKIEFPLFVLTQIMNYLTDTLQYLVFKTVKSLGCNQSIYKPIIGTYDKCDHCTWFCFQNQLPPRQGATTKYLLHTDTFQNCFCNHRYCHTIFFCRDQSQTACMIMGDIWKYVVTTEKSGQKHLKK